MAGSWNGSGFSEAPGAEGLDKRQSSLTALGVVRSIPILFGGHRYTSNNENLQREAGGNQA